MGAYGRIWAHFSTFAKMRPGRILFLVYSHMRPGRILALLIKCAHVLKRAPGRILALLIKCAHSAFGRIGRIWAHMGAYGRNLAVAENKEFFYQRFWTNFNLVNHLTNNPSKKYLIFNEM